MKTLRTKRYLSKDTVRALKSDYSHVEGFKIRKIKGYDAYTITLPYNDRLDVKMFAEYIINNGKLLWELTNELMEV